MAVYSRNGSRASLAMPAAGFGDLIRLFCAAFKVYSGFSARRFMSDLREANERKYIDKVPHFNSVLNALESPDLRSVLTDMIEASALPLRAIETDFACDSSGFSTGRFERWFDHKWGKERPQSPGAGSDNRSLG